MPQLRPACDHGAFSAGGRCRWLVSAVACLLAGTGVAAEEPPVVTPSQPAAQPAEISYRRVYPQMSGPSFSWEYHALPAQGTAAEVEARTRITAALDRVLEEKLEFDETPLADVVMMLQAVLETPVTIDVRALEQAGIAPDTPVTGTGRAVSTRSFLRRVLRSINLTFRLQDETLLITTQEEDEVNPEVLAYPLPYGLARGPWTDFQSLIELIQNTVEPPTWDTQGGPGAIRPLDASGEPMLVVTQSAAVHEKVEALLATLHARGLAAFGGPGEDARPVTKIHHVDDDQLRTDLTATLVELTNGALTEGQDDEAAVHAVGTSLVVRSKSPGFHVRAAQLIDAVQGVEVPAQGVGQISGGSTGVFGGGGL